MQLWWSLPDSGGVALPLEIDSTIQLVNAGKFYKGLPNQDQALEWLKSKLTKHALSLFAKRWN